jgi:hypothetical protein
MFIEALTSIFTVETSLLRVRHLAPYINALRSVTLNQLPSD